VKAILSRLSWRRKRALLPAEEFAVLCQEEIPSLLRLARRLTGGNHDAAQDLVQETLIRALEAFLRDGYAERGNLRAYLMRILTNRFLSTRRREARHPVAPLDDVLEQEILPTALRGVSVEALVLEQVMDEPLERALAALPEGLRAAVLLVDVEGLEYREAAEALGIPVGTVRSRLFRARQLLHQALLPTAIAGGWSLPQEVLLR
jgi:RNA polymerase sigma-70 factor, ECF subfamily